MATSIVKVYNSKRGRWEEGAEVRLHWNGFFSNLGRSKLVRTDSNGQAIIEYTATGTATVNGREEYSKKILEQFKRIAITLIYEPKI